MSDTPETDEINLLLENLDELIDDSLENSKPIGLTLCSARRTIVDQRARITELWEALGMVIRQRDRMEEELNDAWKERDEARRGIKELKRAAIEVLKVVPVAYCSEMHHGKRDMHSALEPCPVVDRYNAKIDKLLALLKEEA